MTSSARMANVRCSSGELSVELPSQLLSAEGMLPSPCPRLEDAEAITQFHSSRAASATSRRHSTPTISVRRPAYHHQAILDSRPLSSGLWRMSCRPCDPRNTGVSPGETGLCSMYGLHRPMH